MDQAAEGPQQEAEEPEQQQDDDDGRAACGEAYCAASRAHALGARGRAPVHSRPWRPSLRSWRSTTTLRSSGRSSATCSPDTDPTTASLRPDRAPRHSRLVRELTRRGDPVALFVVDQRMPAMTGIELLAEALAAPAGREAGPADGVCRHRDRHPGDQRDPPRPVPAQAVGPTGGAALSRSSTTCWRTGWPTSVRRSRDCASWRADGRRAGTRSATS